MMRIRAENTIAKTQKETSECLELSVCSKIYPDYVIENEELSSESESNTTRRIARRKRKTRIKETNYKKRVKNVAEWVDMQKEHLRNTEKIVRRLKDQDKVNTVGDKTIY